MRDLEAEFIKAEAQTSASNHIASAVRIRGLTSESGIGLNGRLGVVRKIDQTGRRLVYIEGVGVKSIKPDNLTVETVRGYSGAFIDDGLTEEDIICQVAIESSTTDLQAAQFLGQAIERDEANSRISDALVHKHYGDNAKVVHLRLSRACEAVHEQLVNAPELAATIAALESRHFSIKADSGTFVFVHPDHYECVVTAIEHYAFHGKDVICEPHLEQCILNLVKSMKKTNKVYPPKKTNTIPIGFLMKSKELDLHVTIRKRLIDIKVPSSLRSGSVTEDGPATV